MEVANAVSNLQMLGLLLLCLCATTSSQSRNRPFRPIMPGPFIPHDYTHSADVARLCHSILSSPSAAEVKVEADGVNVLMHQLSFTNGDWIQDEGQASLMPFQGSHADTPVGPLEAVRLASFMPTHVDTVAQRRRGATPTTAVNVSGCMSFTVTRAHCCPPMEPHVSPEFELGSGFAALHVVFEGVYTEIVSPGSDDRERVLCMVGNAVLPVRGGGNGSADPWDWAKAEYGDGGRGFKFKPPVTAGGNVLLTLQYPKEHTLTTRAVVGEMRSTGDQSSSAFFDTVRIVSRLGPFSRYQFQPEEELHDVTGCSELYSSTCEAGNLYRGASFCDILEQFSPGENDVLPVVPNWRCTSNDEFCSRLGPFDVPATGIAFSRSAIALLDLRCEPTTSVSAAAARVSAMFRVVPPQEHHAVAARRTGLSGMTMSAEGVWKASTGRLCMVACLGVGVEASSCHHRVSLHVATAFSITRRGIIVGEITSTDDGGSRSPPLVFEQRVSAGQPWNRFGPNEESVRMVYHYTKIEQVIELRKKRGPSLLRDSFMARSMLSYPSVTGAADDMASLSELAGDLCLRFRSVSKLPFLPLWVVEPIINFDFQILSTGPLVGTYSPPEQREHASMSDTNAERSHDHGAEKHQLLNVSAYFTASGSRGSLTRFSGRAVMTLEGVYSPDDGRMYLIGCRNIDASWRVSSTSRDLEDGMDCSIEVVVEYPPTTTRWLVSPTARVHFASTRDADDPLYFNSTELRSPPINYSDQRDVLTEHVVEKLLCIAMLTVAVAATVSQLRHVNSHAGVARYVSLAMLGVQALGYCLTLVTEAKMLPAWPNYHSMLRTGYLHWDMDCSIKTLTLAALLLTARLAQKVRRARERVRARAPHESRRVPSDGAVVVYTAGVHMCGLFFVLTAHWLSTRGTSLTPEERGDASRLPPSQMRTQGAVVERYVGVVKEWFLLPQVIGNAVWRVNCKPLGTRYYAGVTTVWLMPHVYGYLRPPMVTMYPEIRNDVMDLCTRAFDVVVPVVGVLLALAVYAQQRWNYRIVGWTMKTEQNKLQHVH